MAAMLGSAVPIGNAILAHFNPAKSPFYGVIAFGTAALLLTCQGIAPAHWQAVSVPIWCVLAIAWSLSLNDAHTFEPGQHEDQLRFARSLSISGALLALVLTARAVDAQPMAFWLNYIACFFQVLVFLLYTWARSRRCEDCSGMNFVQFALITTTFLVGASYGLSKYASLLAEDTPVSTDEAFRFLSAAISLYALWALCVLRWCKHLFTLVRITRT